MNTNKWLVAAVFFLSAFVYTLSLQAQTAPLKHGHAHNDYVHKRPLFEALENGFTSIEIDVFLHNNQLVVSHVAMGLSGKKNITELYLQSIKKITEQNGGWVYKGFETPVILMIDFKTHTPETYTKLKETLEPYKDLLTLYKNGKVIRQGALNILISGGGPVQEILKEDTSIATIDGGIGNMNDTISARAITRYSAAWETYFSWIGIGKMPRAQKHLLKELTARAHEQQKDIRFYHIPDKPNCWRVLLNAGVDWINTNRLTAFSQYYLTKYRR